MSGEDIKSITYDEAVPGASYAHVTYGMSIPMLIEHGQNLAAALSRDMQKNRIDLLARMLERSFGSTQKPPSVADNLRDSLRLAAKRQDIRPGWWSKFQKGPWQ